MIISNVRKIMENQTITIRKMVEDTGIADKTILRARSENITKCRMGTLEEIANYLNCAIKDLFDEVEKLG